MRIPIFIVALLAGVALARAADEWQIDATVFEANEKLPDRARDAVAAVMDANGSVAPEKLEAALRALREAGGVDVVSMPSTSVKIGQTGSLAIYPAGRPPQDPEAKRPVLELFVKPAPKGERVKLDGRLVFRHPEPDKKSDKDGQTLVYKTFEASFSRMADPGGTVGIWGWTRSQTLQIRDSNADGSDPKDHEETRELRAGFFVTVKPAGGDSASGKENQHPPAARHASP